MKNSPIAGRRGRPPASPLTPAPSWTGDIPNDEAGVKAALLRMIESNGGHTAARYASALFPTKGFRRSQTLAWLGELESTHLRHVERTVKGSDATYNALYIDGYLYGGDVYTIRELADHPANADGLSHQAIAYRLGKGMSVADALGKAAASNNNHR